MSSGAMDLPNSVLAQQRHDDRRWRLLYAQVLIVALMIALLAYGTAPAPFSIAILALLIYCIAIVVRPILGVYGAVFLTMIGDTVTVPWYPFTKNLSSRESILFISDALTISPFELTIALTALSWILRMLGDANWQFKRGAMWTSIMVFTGFVFLGLFYGLSGAGHDTTVAVWEVRPLLYVSIVYVLITNLLTTGRQYERLFMCAVVGVVVQSLLSLQYFNSLDPELRENLDSLTEHAASIHVDVVIIFVLAIWLLPRCRPARRVWVSVALVPCVWMFVIAERRAAAIALMIGVLAVAVLIYPRRRAAAVWFTLFAVVIGGLYTAAFWNSTGSIGFGAQAIKSVIAPGQLSAEDQSSDLYRQIEAYDLWYTIRSNELFGVGFGQKFLRPVALPDISFFVFWEYLPHNSILWIWMKMGVGGFMSMLFLIARTIHRGVRSAMRIQSLDLTSVVIASVVYVVMYTVYCYVDIGWDVRSTVFLAMAIAICADLETLLEPPEDEVEGESSVTDDLELVS
jgi:O-antigen ligase